MKKDRELLELFYTEIRVKLSGSFNPETEQYENISCNDLYKLGILYTTLRKFEIEIEERNGLSTSVVPFPATPSL